MYRVILALVLLLAACSPAAATASADPTASDLDAARQHLIDFFDFVAAGDYQAAVTLHGSNPEFYEFNRQNNPDIDPQDRAALLEAACQRQLVCMAIERIVSAEQLKTDEYLFVVEFSDPGGGTYVMGPCCGADETEMPPTSEFEYIVEKIGEEFVVIGGPLYVP